MKDLIQTSGRGSQRAVIEYFQEELRRAFIDVSATFVEIPDLEGRFYKLFVFGDAALAALSALLLGIRLLASKSRVQRQRMAVAVAFILIGAALIFISTGLLTTGQAKRPSYAFAPVGALFLAGGITYAFRLSRLFDWRTIGRTLLGYAALFGAVGLPAGIVVALLVLAGKLTSTAVPSVSV